MASSLFKVEGWARGKKFSGGISMRVFILFYQVLILIAISVAGKWLQNYFHLPIPGSLVGLILLFALLYFSILPVKWFEVGAEKLVAFIPLFLIPSTTGVINYGSFFLHKGSIVVLAVIISTLLILIVSGSVSQTLSQFKKSKSNRKGIEAEL